ncbi:hypothetical protein DIPPA_07126 [Diplonema papillatum]|nr:hypothetical protein DIPPA_07126 [Diplonema papillatum]
MYSPVLPDRAEVECESKTVGDVRAALAKMKKAASAGMHGWRIHELQQLPNSLLEGFARVLNEVEESGEWPEELLHALVSLIPKPKRRSIVPTTDLSGTSAVQDMCCYQG